MYGYCLQFNLRLHLGCFPFHMPPMQTIVCVPSRRYPALQANQATFCVNLMVPNLGAFCV